MNRIVRSDWKVPNRAGCRARRPVASATTNTPPPRRAAPRRSPRPSRALRRANHAAAAVTNNTPAKKAALLRRARNATACGASRDGSLHGATISNETGRPRKAAATTWSVTPPPPGIGPLKPAIESKGTGGSHAGSDAAKDFTSSPVSEKRVPHAGGAEAAAAGGKAWGGMATKDRRRPWGSRTTVSIPVTSRGGSDRCTAPSAFEGRSGRGLWRYSKLAGFHQPAARSRAHPDVPVLARWLRKA